MDEMITGRAVEEWFSPATGEPVRWARWVDSSERLFLREYRKILNDVEQLSELEMAEDHFCACGSGRLVEACVCHSQHYVQDDGMTYLEWCEYKREFWGLEPSPTCPSCWLINCKCTWDAVYDDTPQSD